MVLWIRTEVEPFTWGHTNSGLEDSGAESDIDYDRLGHRLGNGVLALCTRFWAPPSVCLWGGGGSIE